MKIYTVESIEGYEFCHPINHKDFELINTLINGKPRYPNWVPIKMRIIQRDEGQELFQSDSPWLGSNVLILRESVIEIKEINDLLNRFGELLPLECGENKVFIYNPTRLIDALDEEESKIVRFKDGNIMMIKEYVFYSDKLNKIDVFKIPNLQVSPIFVSQRFVELWNSASLKGLNFKMVWKKN